MMNLVSNGRSAKNITLNCRMSQMVSSCSKVYDMSRTINYIILIEDFSLYADL